MDGRKLNHDSLDEMRIRAVRRVQDGESPELVAKVLGIHRSVICEWLARYRAGGWDGLKAKPIPVRPPRLNGRQIRWIHQTVFNKDPLQLKSPFALWAQISHWLY